MIEHDDHELRERFASMRRENGAAVPAFRRSLATARVGPNRRRLGFAVAAVLAVVALVATLTGRDRHPTPVDLAGVRVHAPTDFLLKLPGAELLRTVPRLGRVSHDWRTL